MEPIRVGDKFEVIGSGMVWEVTRDLCFGRVDVICRDRCLQGMKHKKDLRDATRYQRMSGNLIEFN